MVIALPCPQQLRLLNQVISSNFIIYGARNEQSIDLLQRPNVKANGKSMKTAALHGFLALIIFLKMLENIAKNLGLTLPLFMMKKKRNSSRTSE